MDVRSDVAWERASAPEARDERCPRASARVTPAPRVEVPTERPADGRRAAGLRAAIINAMGVQRVPDSPRAWFDATAERMLAVGARSATELEVVGDIDRFQRDKRRRMLEWLSRRDTAGRRIL